MPYVVIRKLSYIIATTYIHIMAGTGLLEHNITIYISLFYLHIIYHWTIKLEANFCVAAFSVLLYMYVDIK